MFALHWIEMYWIHAECCVAFLSVSQHGDECSHWQKNQSSLCGAKSCRARQPSYVSLSLSLTAQTCGCPTQKIHTINKFTLSRSDLVFHAPKQISLQLQNFRKLSSRIRHIGSLFFMSCSMFLLSSFPSPVMKKATQRGPLSRWKWEFEIVS